MSMLLRAQEITKSRGNQTLFTSISFSITQGDKIGLIGPNGSGKSTLLKLLLGDENPDNGSISRKQGLRIGYASQSPDFGDISVEEVLLSSLCQLSGDEVERRTRARTLLSRAQFSSPALIASKLSGGWKKRLDIIRALMQEPDILLLDEPTNHLDIEGIEWLEALLARERVTYVIVSHDRYFLENVTNKTIELNRCFPQGLLSFPGTFSNYLEHKQAFLEAQLQKQSGLHAKVREELEWLKRSPKARTTKSRARINKTLELNSELQELASQNKKSTVSLTFEGSERETRKLLVTKNLTKSTFTPNEKSSTPKTLFKGIDLTLSPGSRLGIVGGNGTGKTTLLRVLAGEIAQDAGTIKYADALRLVYFDQHREKLDPNSTIREALCPNGEFVTYRGQQIHVNGWAKKFLFHQDRLTLPVKFLSGGEKARILLARLMLQPADILFLDEPTNDLDIDTLEILEDRLEEFPGAIVLITHDRCLMDRVCKQVIGLGTDNETEIFADYAQWEEASRKKTDAPQVQSSKTTAHKGKESKKLSYKEQRELDGIEQEILTLEQKIEAVERELNLHNDQEPCDSQGVVQLYHSLSALQSQLEGRYERWQELLSRSNETK